MNRLMLTINFLDRARKPLGCYSHGRYCGDKRQLVDPRRRSHYAWEWVLGEGDPLVSTLR